MQITTDILEIAKRGSRRTRIMYLGNLSYDLLCKYTDYLGRLGMIEVDAANEKTTYVITKKGLNFLQEYHEFQKHMLAAQAKKRALERMLSEPAGH